MAVLNFAYLKQVRPVQSTFTPSTAITTSVISRDVEVLPFPSIQGISAASTVVIDRISKAQWFSPKAYSAYFALASAATSEGATINFF